MRTLLLALAATLALTSLPVRADENAAAADTKALIEKVQNQLKAGKRSEADLAAEFKEFDALAAKYAGEPEAAAHILYMKASLYLQVLHDTTKGSGVLDEIKSKYPKTEIASKVEEIKASLKQQEQSQKINSSLVPGAIFPAFEVTDLDGKPLSIASRKAKVVLIDFWATWCPPCVRELPNVVATYGKYHDKGFDVIGISLDKDKATLTSFIAEKKMPWPQYFDGLGWSNKLAKEYGITSIPATFLVDGNGKIIARDLRGEALEEAVAKALGGN